MLPLPPPGVLVRRMPQLLLGLVAFGVGIALMIRAGLGLPPWDVFHQGLSRRTDITVGTATIVVGFAVLALWIPLRERLGLGTIANAILIGLTMDATMVLVGDAGGIVTRWVFLLGGLVLVGLGSGAYIGARLGPGPRDGLMTGIARRGTSLRLARFGIEAAVLVAGWAMGGTVGVGTVAFAVGIGPLVQAFLPMFDVDRTVAPGVTRRPSDREHGIDHG